MLSLKQLVAFANPKGQAVRIENYTSVKPDIGPMNALCYPSFRLNWGVVCEYESFKVCQAADFLDPLY